MQKSYLSSYNRNVMYDKGKGEHNGVEYVYTKYRRLDTVTEAYAYKTDEYFYFTARNVATISLRERLPRNSAQNFSTPRISSCLSTCAAFFVTGYGSKPTMP